MNKEKKTDRINKTKLSVAWPKSLFTIKELHAENPNFVEITLRVRLKKAIDSGEVCELGTMHNGKGRPTNILVYGPVTQNHIDLAKIRDITLKSEKMLTVANISNKSLDSVINKDKTELVEQSMQTVNINDSKLENA